MEFILGTNSVIKTVSVIKLCTLPLYLFFSVICLAHSAHAHPGDEHKLTHLDQLISQQKGDQNTYIQRGALYTRAGQYDLALADFDTALSFGNPVLVSFELGIYYFTISEYTKAAQHFDQYLNAFPAFLPALEFRAKTARKTGNHQLARDAFELFISLSPYANPGQYLAAAKAEISSSSDSTANIESALSVVDAGIDRFGVVPQLQNYGIDLEVLQSKLQKAIVRHQTLRGILVESPRWLIRHAELLIAANRQKEATPLLILAESKIFKLKSTPALIRLSKRLKELQLIIVNNKAQSLAA